MLDALNEVQIRDLELDAILQERRDVPTDLVDVRAQHDDLAARLMAARHERDDVKAQVKVVEGDLGAIGERRKAASEASLRADSAKEVAQYQNQELQFATRQQELEEDALPLMERLERCEERVAGLEEEWNVLDPRRTELEAAEVDRQTSLNDKEASLSKVRAGLASKVPDTLLRQYESVRRSKRGLGLVELVDGRRCGGCNVQLPIHVLQKAKKAASGIVRCPSCGRILWSKA